MILGINSFTHDSSIALIKKNEPIILLEEERISRIKHHDGFIFGGTPPYNSLRLINKRYNYSKIAHSYDVNFSASNTNLPQLNFLNFAKSLDPKLKRTYFFNHHMCHAASAYYCSNYTSAYIITLDSKGDGLSLSISIGKGNNIDKIFELPSRTSICSIYSYISEVLRLGKRNEGSLMALASFGKQRLVSDIFAWSGFGININKVQLVSLAKKAKKFGDMSNIAFTIQESFESIILDIIRDICIDKDIKLLCLAGGGFLNCSLNKKIIESKRWESIYIPPCSGDSGTALGAALLCLDNPSEFDIKHAYWGTRYSKNYIKILLEKFKLKYQETDSNLLAKLIADGNIVAVFNGAMEFGPRALGNRSLIADPRKLSSKNKLNQIKKRRQWRPIAPIVLDEFGNDWFENYRYTPFMTQAFNIKEDKINKIPAIRHADNSARLQSVTQENKFLYDLTFAFFKLTGVPLLCNTSYNINSPIVQSPADALSIFFTSSIDYLYIEGFLVIK